MDLSKGVAVIKKVIQREKPQNHLLKFHYSGLKKFFMQQMYLYATNKLTIDLASCRLSHREEKARYLIPEERLRIIRKLSK